MSFFKTNLYVLKRQFGVPITLYRITTSSINTLTGAKSTSWESKYISRAVVFPNDVGRDVVAPRVGLTIDSGSTLILIDRNDLPSSWTITPEQVIGRSNWRFDIKAVTMDNQQIGWFVNCVEVKGVTLPIA